MSVVYGFYAFHLHFGRGPVLNPVPANPARRKAMAHRSPLENRARHRRARLRPKLPARQPRAIPDQLVDGIVIDGPAVVGALTAIHRPSRAQ